MKIANFAQLISVQSETVLLTARSTPKITQIYYGHESGALAVTTTRFELRDVKVVANLFSFLYNLILIGVVTPPETR